MIKNIFYKMSTKRLTKTALGKKLNKVNRVQELRGEQTERAKNCEVPDIEDTIKDNCIVKSVFFSPLQTRRQRTVNLNPIQKLELPKTLRKGRKLSIESIKIEDKESLDDKVELEKDDLNVNSFNIELPSVELKSKELAVELNESNFKIKRQPKGSKNIEKIETVDVNIEITSPNEKTESHIKTEENVWEPQHWRQIFENVRKMRASAPAPVDTMGCDACADKDSNDKTQRFHKLVALMLSSQTKDETTFEAMKRLKEQTLTPETIVEINTKTLEELLCPVSFYKNKAKYLQQTSRILIDKYNSDIPNNIKELIALPGVGPKMAHICMSTAWNEITGIGVDVHVHRISNRLGWVTRETKEPEQTRKELEAWLPRGLWHDVNYLFVGFGQTICTPQRPKCGECLNRNICPSADKVTPKKKSSSREENTNTSPTKPAKRTPMKKNEEHADMSTAKKAKQAKKKMPL